MTKDKNHQDIVLNAYKIDFDFYSRIQMLFLEHRDCKSISCSIDIPATIVGVIDRSYIGAGLLMVVTAIGIYMGNTDIEDEFAIFLDTGIDLKTYDIGSIVVECEVSGPRLCYTVSTFAGCGTDRQLSTLFARYEYEVQTEAVLSRS